jgi:hypothetical protein
VIALRQRAPAPAAEPAAEVGAAAEGEPAARPTAPSPVPFELFAGHERSRAPAGRVDLAEARAILDQGKFWTEYQVLVHARTGRTSTWYSVQNFP